MKDKKYQVYEAYDDGMLLFEATLDELCDVFDSNVGKLMRTIRKGAIIDKMYNIVDKDNPVKLRKVPQYCVYDMENDEQLVFIGLKEELTEKFDIKAETLFAGLSRNGLFKKRYLIQKV
jgi:hypothetical protein